MLKKIHLQGVCNLYNVTYNLIADLISSGEVSGNKGVLLIRIYLHVNYIKKEFMEFGKRSNLIIDIFNVNGSCVG